MTKPVLGLFGVFAPLSLVADIQRQVVEVHHWMTPTGFLNAFAISRMAPGPGSLLATLIGWQVAGFWGAVAATLGIFGPTAVLIYGVAQLWTRYRGARWQLALEGGLRPVAAGMILAAVYVLMQTLEGGWLAQGIALLSTTILMLTRVNPILLLVCGAGIFVGLHGLAAA